MLLAERLAAGNSGLKIDLIYGETEGSRIVELQGVLPKKVKLHLVTEDGTVGARGKVTDVLAGLFASGRSPLALYTCGPKAMMAAVAGMADLRQVALFEASCEENMACGLGICQGCVIPVKAGDGLTHYQRCCTEGPVFDGWEVNWQTG